MPTARPRKSRNDWIKAAYLTLADAGVEQVRVEALARKLGVTKGSFYWHFKDRQALLEATLDAWEERGTDWVISEVEAASDDPTTRAARLWEIVSRDGRIVGELTLRQWARRDEDVAARVRRVDERRIETVRNLLSDLNIPKPEIEPRAHLLYSLLIGESLIATPHNPATTKSALKLLTSPPPA